MKVVEIPGHSFPQGCWLFKSLSLSLYVLGVESRATGPSPVIYREILTYIDLSCKDYLRELRRGGCYKMMDENGGSGRKVGMGKEIEFPL